MALENIFERSRQAEPWAEPATSQTAQSQTFDNIFQSKLEFLISIRLFRKENMVLIICLHDSSFS